MTRALFLACALLCGPALAQSAAPVLPQAKAYTTPDSWRQPVAPVRIADNAMPTATMSARWPQCSAPPAPVSSPAPNRRG